MTAAANETETAFEQTAAQLGELNKSIVTEAKKAGNVSLDVYETTLRTIADYTEKVGTASSIDAVRVVTRAQADLTRELAGAYASAARAFLS
jgi:hypothetical protein